MNRSLPVIDRPIDNTAMSAYMACPREYFFGMILHRRAAGDSAALSYGGLWHKILEVHYKTDGNRDAVMLAAELSWKGDQEGEYRTLGRAKVDYDRYVKKYGRPSREEGKTVGYPDAPLVEIATNAQGRGLLHPWAGKIDRIVELNGLYYVDDHKTTSRLDKNYFKQYPLSNQMKGYTYLAQELLPDLPIAGVRINLAHVLTNDTAFHRQFFTYSRPQIDEWIKVQNSWFRKLEDDIHIYQHQIAAGVESHEAMLEAFPAHFGDNGCSRKFGMCQYHPVCETSPAVQLRILARDYEEKPWNPLDIED